MSSSAIISEVSNLLKEVLKQGLATPADQNPTVELSNPADEASDKILSIWLYQVTPNAYLRNVPKIPVGTDQERYPPLTLDLYYLLTPYKKDEAANQATMGRALQVLHDNSILTVSSGGNVEELHLNICQRSIEELANVWEALQKPYRLSVCFEVRVVRIDSERVVRTGRIRERITEFQDKPLETVL